ncbi:hypothetical protein B0H13DRAFT_2343719 [Mycena leptocephala]|nr:hypothetical protein B0H13DRAFT_2343719 [Mycena leptocephala]
MPSSFPSSILVSPATRMLFSSNKSSIIWDSQSLHVIELSFDINDVSSATPKVIQELRSDGGEIADVSTSGDDLVVLTRFATGAEWRRPWKRRFDEGEDFWAGNRPLYTYAITAYSVERHLQIGETVQIPYHGVYASIRSGFHKAVVRMIGPKCVSTFWDLPTQESPKWKAVHAELSWDPEIIALKMRYQNSQAELQSRGSGECERYHHKDKEILDYVFLSPNLMLRLSEVTLDRADAQFDIQVFSIPTGFAEGMEPFEAPSIFTLGVADSDTSIEMSEATLDTDIAYSPNSPNFVVVAVRCCDNPCARVILKVATLLNFVENPSALPAIENTEYAGAECSREEWQKLEFLGYTTSCMWPNLSHIGPSIHARVVFLPICADTDPRCVEEPEPVLRFMRLPEDGTTPTNINIPVTTLVPDAPHPIPGFARYEKQSYPPVIAKWDGGDILCIVVRDGEYVRDPVSRGWFVRLDPSVMQRIGVTV